MHGHNQSFRSLLRRTSAAVIAVGLVLSMGCSTSPEIEDEGVHAHHEDDAHQAPHTHESRAHHDHLGHHDHRFEDAESYAKRWNDPARHEWQQPEQVVAAMEIEEGMTVADLGAGTGYFLPFLSEAVGPEGRVLAADVEPSMLEYMQGLIDEMELTNVEIIHADYDHSRLPEGAVDRLITVNTWHHIADRGEYSAHLRTRLTEEGSVWIVDFHQDSPTGPPAHHRLPEDVVVQELQAGGLNAAVHPLRLERQYIVVGHR